MPEPGRRAFAVAVCTVRRARSLRRFLDSLAFQRPRPDELVVVDGSPDDETERMLTGHPHRGALAARVRYERVEPARLGLTRQRNVALELVRSELVAFFDDDVVLLPDCLAALLAGHRDAVVGVGALVANEQGAPHFGWRLRRLLRVVPTLEPGRYCATGVSTPWRFHDPPPDALVDGEWLPGGATMWCAPLARALRFAEGFAGYASGEDLEFSLRAGRHGRLVLATAARVLHLHEPGGRPDPYRLGYSTVRNHHHIHASSAHGGRRSASLRFGYAAAIETLAAGAGLLRAGRAAEGWRYVRGAARFAGERLGAVPAPRWCEG
jgi:GT2 family glycosyltransferase